MEPYSTCLWYNLYNQTFVLCLVKGRAKDAARGVIYIQRGNEVRGGVLFKGQEHLFGIKRKENGSAWIKSR